MISIIQIKLIPKWIIAIFIILSFFGFLDASYLTLKHYLGTPLNCSVFEGCEKVANSPYAVILGVPVALLGMIYYTALFFLSYLYYETKNPRLAPWILGLPVAGFLFSLYLVYLQLFVIKAICVYCAGSALISTILFILSLVLVLSASATRTKQGSPKELPEDQMMKDSPKAP